MFSRSGLYAIRATAMLAGLPEGAYEGTQQIAAAADVPPSYLSKLLQALGRAGLVDSHKGPGGGFRLTRPAEHITLWDVLEPIEDFSRPAGCVLGRPACSEENPCALHEPWKVIRGDYFQMLRETTLAGLADHSAADRLLRDFDATKIGQSCPISI